MRVLVLGASGRVGILVVREALSRGYTVTALVRNKESLESIATVDSALMLIKGQPQNSKDIERAFNAVADDRPAVVIVALNNGRTSDNPFSKSTAPPTFMHDCHLAVMEGMKKHGTRKIVTLQACGVGDSYANLFFLVRLLIRFTNLGVGYKDHGLVEDLVKKSGLNYVLVRPSRLVGGPSAHISSYGNRGDGIGAFAKISRQSVANFLLDAAERSAWDGTTPVISN